MNEKYKIISEWDYYDGTKAGVCERNGKHYVYWLHDWSMEGHYPLDDDGNDLPRSYDLYEYEEHKWDLDNWNWDKVDAYLATVEPIGQCTENQLDNTDLNGTRYKKPSQGD